MTKLTYDNLIDENPEVNVIDRDFNSNKIKGLYYNGNIAINSKIETTAEKTCVLAEELGHHYTSTGIILDMDNTSNRKQEYLARMWGYNKLIGLQGLIDAFEHHCQGLHEVAEFLEVTEEFLIETVNAYMHKYGPYIKYKQYIIEFNFNSVGIIKKFNTGVKSYGN